MSDIAFHVENLGKRYRIGQRERYLALRDVLTRAISAPARLFGPKASTSSNGDRSHIWALKDVSFDIRQGEVVGIIGRNGAGKSTLLKILARVTKPTRGFAEVRGRMGTLLEVGTGFHPELTGRENVFLSGAILGMGKSEIRRKFDEIVAFAEVEEFIDTPLKHYSSGMQMRLAFAVAAHLEPEILLVDEVLAVGDIEFQKKCLGKMGDVAKRGRTILFVSHQMNQIRRLCERAVWIDTGTIRADGIAKLVVNEYEAAGLPDGKVARMETEATIVLERWQVESSCTNILDLDNDTEKVVIELRAHVIKPFRKGQYYITLRDGNNIVVWSKVKNDLALEAGPVIFVHEFKNLPLVPGVYHWTVGVNDGHRWFDFTLAPELSIVSKNDSDIYSYLKGFLNLDCQLHIQTRTTPATTELAVERVAL